ncbi:MAG TPA: hypothetical protein PL089_15410 [Ignavibacteria bacterium]|nr:hypothetical protein [Ignavibacteria bacterium]
MKTKKNYRQGDVFIIERTFPFGNAKQIKEKILAYGEVTGHKHVLKGELEIIENQDGCFVRVKNDSVVTHEEHDTINIPPGEYEIRIQREYDPINYARKVAD